MNTAMQTRVNHTKSVQLIWYNPDLNIYQSGSETDFEKCLEMGYNQTHFSVLHEYTKTSKGLVSKVVNSLNSVQRSN